MPPPSPPLVDDLVEQVLLRFPPDDPAALVRAALVCKRWRRLVSGPGFRRRFGEFQRTPPMLGVFCWNRYSTVDRFVPTTAFRPCHAERAHMHALDARHGRVLFRGKGKATVFLGGGRPLVVWDPITDEEWKVPFPPLYAGALTWTASILCSAAGAGSCDHLDCNRGPFTVVFAGTVLVGPDVGRDIWETLVCAYSSDAAAWSEPTYCQRTGYSINHWTRSALVGNALYFWNLAERTALKYNLELHQMSWMQLPFCWQQQFVLTTMEDGGLGLASEHESKLYIWSPKDADELGAGWEQKRVIKLRTLLPVDADFTSLRVVGSMDDLGTVFVSAKDVAYAIDLKTYKVKKVYEGTTSIIVPYMSFYTPALQADDTGEGSSAGGSSA